MKQIDTPYRQYEENALNEYIEDIASPLGFEELREEYPDIAEACDDAFSGYIGTMPDEDIELEKYDVLLKHHNETLLSELSVDFIMSPLYLAMQKMGDIISQYARIPSESKSEYLKKCHRKYRDYINEDLQSGSTLMLTSDYSRHDIFNTFNPDDTSRFQELLTAYFIAFFCDYYSRNEDMPVDEALMKYSEAPIKTTQSFTDMFKSMADWVNIADESEFDLSTFIKKDLIIEMMEDLSITNNGEYIGSDRSKSKLLGFVKACQEEGLLPDDSIDKVVESIAHHIKMKYSARLQESKISDRVYLRTLTHIKDMG